MEKKFYHRTKIGIFEISVEDDILLSFKLTDKNSDSCKETTFLKKLTTQIDEYFDLKRQKFEININPKGTEFQKKVWSELRKIPYGETRSYSEIAEKLGNKNSSRAVGNACNKNPILLVIPCHRVISKSGKLSGFACGVNIKEELLKQEKLSAIQ